MIKYVVFDNKNCSLQALGEYETFDEALDAAAVLESCGMDVTIKPVSGEQNE